MLSFYIHLLIIALSLVSSQHTVCPQSIRYTLVAARRFPPHWPLRWGERWAEEYLRVWVLAFPSMSAQRSMQVSRGYPHVHSVTAVCFPADNTARAAPAHFLLYLSNTPQVVQERRRRRLGSWQRVQAICQSLESSHYCLCLGISPSLVYKWFNKKHVNTMGYASLYCGGGKKSMTQWVNMLWNLLQKLYLF